MLKASKVRLMDGKEYTDIELIPSDDGIVLMVDGEVIHVMHHAVSSIHYTDPGSQHFARGRALAMYFNDADSIREILEDFDFELNELAKFIAESLEPANEEGSKPEQKGENPYA